MSTVAYDWSRDNVSPRKQRLPRDWHIVRARILDRDQHTCQQCGDRADQVDHLDDDTTGSVPDERLQSLCRPCHLRRTAQQGGRARAAAMRAIKRAPLPHPGIIEGPRP